MRSTIGWGGLRFWNTDIDAVMVERDRAEARAHEPGLRELRLVAPFSSRRASQGG
jgi:hypothetical protein